MNDETLETLTEKLLIDFKDEITWRAFARLWDIKSIEWVAWLSRKHRMSIQDAEDFIAEAKRIVLERIESKSMNPDNIRAFALKTALNIFYYGLKTSRRQEKTDAQFFKSQTANDKPPVEAQGISLKVFWLTILKTLAEPCKSLLTKFYVYKESAREIASSMPLESFVAGKMELIEDEELAGSLKEVDPVFVNYAVVSVYEDREEKKAFEKEIRQALEHMQANDFREKIEQLERAVYHEIRPGNNAQLGLKKTLLREILIRSGSDLLDHFPELERRQRFLQRITTLKEKKVQESRRECIRKAHQYLNSLLKTRPERKKEYELKAFRVVDGLEEPCRTILLRFYGHEKMPLIELLEELKREFASKAPFADITTESQLRKKKNKCLNDLDDAVFRLIESE